jgi:hypothetical protein
MISLLSHKVDGWVMKGGVLGGIFTKGTFSIVWGKRESKYGF